MFPRTVLLAHGLIALLAVAALSGCSNELRIDNSSGAPQQVATQERLVAKANSPVADVPIPIGFDISEGDSNAQVTGQMRYVCHTYKGRKAKDRVASFYCEQLVTNNKWRQDGVRKNNGVWRLHFTKGIERCDIAISENMWGTTRIEIEIYPVTGAPAATGGS
ncbi:MAG: hypothetical protein PHU85_10035 [Phycisphaerae bacterium]|nr:hypothetical protein [Phycisphaerae bacterium]